MGVYNIAKERMVAGTLGWTSVSVIVRALLVAPTYAFSPVHRYVSDVVGHEVGSASYARVTVTGRTSSRDDALHLGSIHADDTVFPALADVTAGGVVLYTRVGGDDLTPADDVLIVFYALSPVVVADGSHLKVEYNIQGLVALG